VDTIQTAAPSTLARRSGGMASELNCHHGIGLPRYWREMNTWLGDKKQVSGCWIVAVATQVFTRVSPVVNTWLLGVPWG
jgi:hypothetical protein